MPKYYGAIGYGEDVETAPGVWLPQITERNYTGDIIRDDGKWQNGEDLNLDLTIDNRISIVADKYAYSNFHSIRYVTWLGKKWKVNSVNATNPPRLILTIGGLFNE